MLGFNKVTEGGSAFDEKGLDDDFTRKLVATRRSEIEAFAESLKNKSLIDLVSSNLGDDTFSSLIALAVKDYGVSQKQLSQAVKANIATVGRWVAGTSVPPIYARKQVIDAISSVIDYELTTS